MKKLFLIGVFTFLTFVSFAQSFEGWITYKVDALNPNPEMIPDSTWEKAKQKEFGEKGYMEHKYFYKGHSYISEIEVGNQHGYLAFNTMDSLIYTWQVDSDSAITVDSKKYMDEFVEIIDNDSVSTILDIKCNSVIVKSKMGTMTLWYNKDYLKMDASLYKGHKYGHWEQILEKIGCLPIKIEQKGFMSNIVQTAIAFKEEAVSDDKFIIPGFKTLIANPIN